MDKPLVSFCVKCYNQRKYIGEALDGAFAQTYRPLEIVISDNCSMDGSAELIQQKIAAYKAAGGDIPIIFNRNTKNIGNLGNWQVFGRLAHGELLVKADGDDISLPQRTEKCVNAWLACGRKAKIIDHCGCLIDLSGNLLRGTVRFIGACQAYSRDLWDRIPINRMSLDHECVCDDCAFAVRAYALAGEFYTYKIEEKLIRYRFSSGETTQSTTYRGRITKEWKFVRDSIEHSLKELDLNTQTISDESIEKTKKHFSRRLQEAALNYQLLDADTCFRERLAAKRKLEEGMGIKSLRDLLYHLIFLLPPWLADAILAPYFRFFYFRRAYSD